MKVLASAVREEHARATKPLGAALNQAAHAAAHTKNTYLAAQYHRLAGRRGRKKAIVAVAHSILVIAYHLIKRKEPYHELGGNYFDKRQPEVTAKRLLKRLEQLGYQVSVQALLSVSLHNLFSDQHFNKLIQFRQAAYADLETAKDALFELCDAVIGTAAANSFAELSSSKYFRRCWPQCV